MSEAVPMIAGSASGAGLPVLDDLDEVVGLVQRDGRVFIRYSEGPDRDREGPSRDYESGLRLPGLSATPLDPPGWWTRPTREWVARRMCKYADLLRAPRAPRPWLLTGREVGLGPDHEPLLAEVAPIAWVGPRALAQAAQVYHQRFTVGRDSRCLPARRPAHVTEAASDSRCPFCFPAAIAPHQLLVTTEHFYLLAPAGQIVEGFLGIMTHTCRDAPTRLRCLDDVPVPWVEELQALRELVVRFHREVYRAPTLFYEHGRGGGHGSSLPGGDFMFHPHLCALPGELEIHEALRARFRSSPAPQFPLVRTAIGRRPYLYVHTPDSPAHSEPVVYYDPEDDAVGSVDSLSLKQLLTEVNAMDADSNWRRYPGERELRGLVSKFNTWYGTGFRRRSDPPLEAIFSGEGA
ncbi:DUF6098 family protein [Streptomyces sp. HUAS ZL42]|uniref:DUF6098 family protein n=1 Tax=Streptomyces sp. HUAS ZL42 TaxID=3231715 RepID=UPI00345E9B1E